MTKFQSVSIHAPHGERLIIVQHLRSLLLKFLDKDENVVLYQVEKVGEHQLEPLICVWL